MIGHDRPASHFAVTHVSCICVNANTLYKLYKIHRGRLTHVMRPDAPTPLTGAPPAPPARGHWQVGHTPQATAYQWYRHTTGSGSALEGSALKGSGTQGTHDSHRAHRMTGPRLSAHLARLGLAGALRQRERLLMVEGLRQSARLLTPLPLALGALVTHERGEPRAVRAQR